MSFQYQRETQLPRSSLTTAGCCASSTSTSFPEWMQQNYEVEGTTVRFDSIIIIIIIFGLVPAWSLPLRCALIFYHEHVVYGLWQMTVLKSYYQIGRVVSFTCPKKKKNTLCDNSALSDASRYGTGDISADFTKVRTRTKTYYRWFMSWTLRNCAFTVSSITLISGNNSINGQARSYTKASWSVA